MGLGKINLPPFATKQTSIIDIFHRKPPFECGLNLKVFSNLCSLVSEFVPGLGSSFANSRVVKVLKNKKGKH